MHDSALPEKVTKPEFLPETAASGGAIPPRSVITALSSFDGSEIQNFLDRQIMVMSGVLECLIVGCDGLLIAWAGGLTISQHESLAHVALGIHMNSQHCAKRLAQQPVRFMLFNAPAHRLVIANRDEYLIVVWLEKGKFETVTDLLSVLMN